MYQEDPALLATSLSLWTCLRWGRWENLGSAGHSVPSGSSWGFSCPPVSAKEREKHIPLLQPLPCGHIYETVLFAFMKNKENLPEDQILIYFFKDFIYFFSERG